MELMLDISVRRAVNGSDKCESQTYFDGALLIFQTAMVNIAHLRGLRLVALISGSPMPR